MDNKYFRLIVISLSITVVISRHRHCSEEDTIKMLKKPIYDFSMRLLDRMMTEDRGNFVYSPIATWLRLTSLAEGARGQTLKEIFKVTGLTGKRKKICYRRKFRRIFNFIQDNAEAIGSKRKSLIMINNDFEVKKSFKVETELLTDNKVLSLNFENPEESAHEANKEMASKIDWDLQNVFPQDFDDTDFIVSDVTYFDSAWLNPFDPNLTTKKQFMALKSTIELDMMQKLDYFKLVTLYPLNTRVLELPCLDSRLSMLIFLPIEGSVFDLYYVLKDYTLEALLNLLKQEDRILVNVSLPKFNITSEISNLHEILEDMGIKRMFNESAAEFTELTDDYIAVSFMTQMTSIRVKERHELELYSPHDVAANLGEIEEFNVDKPFGFAVVDKRTNIILFAGMYSGVIETEF